MRVVCLTGPNPRNDSIVITAPKSKCDSRRWNNTTMAKMCCLSLIKVAAYETTRTAAAPGAYQKKHCSGGVPVSGTAATVMLAPTVGSATPTNNTLSTKPGVEVVVAGVQPLGTRLNDWNDFRYAVSVKTCTLKGVKSVSTRVEVGAAHA